VKKRESEIGPLRAPRRVSVLWEGHFLGLLACFLFSEMGWRSRIEVGEQLGTWMEGLKVVEVRGGRTFWVLCGT